ncbi:MAG: hypothetical protein PHD29_06585 [bacterium]|nr:hypothetical protein [bacterium]MDD5353794.1 hypothetical protein [bacterium]MDD5757210.1 hypothetical protein [bacterium]
MRKQSLLDKIELAKINLYNKLMNLDIKSINISTYNQRYLESKISNLADILQLYGSLLYVLLNDKKIDYEKFVLVDYGGGSGIISFLAAEMGIKNVIYNDIYDISCSDVANLSKVLELELAHIVCGDVEELISYLHVNSILINAIVSYDVLEHIYNIEWHFNKLATLQAEKFCVVYASAANIENIRYVRTIKQKQIEVEYRTREMKWGHKERDTLKAYFDVRKDIICQYAPDLSLAVIEQLAHSTRGLIRRDIEKYVDEFRKYGKVSYKMEHPTNTCDPYTGNWCEHLINLKWLEKIVKHAGFSVQMLPGYYNINGLLVHRVVKILLNTVIRILGRRSFLIAPYYIVHAESGCRMKE